MATTFDREGCTFDPEAHVYTIRGAPVLSITQALAAIGLGSSFYTQEGRERGSEVHAAIEYLDEGDLDLTTVPDGLRGYVDSYGQFLADHKPTWSWIETPMYSVMHGFGGTPDRIGSFHSSTDTVIVDIKTGKPAAGDGLQLAAQDILLQELAEITHSTIFSRRWFNLYLDGSGGPARLIPRCDGAEGGQARAVLDFLAALRVAYWKLANKVKS